MFEKYMVLSMYAMATVALVACNDDDGRQLSVNNKSTQSGRYRRGQRPYLHFVYTIVTSNFRFYNTMLNLHQDLRTIHGAGYLLWQDELHTKAMNCLNAIIDGQIDPPQDDEHCYTYVLPGAERVTANTIFDLWYQEGADYDYTQEPNNRDAEHFTQIVWKSSTTVGFAFKYEDGTSYFAAVYSPEGNVAGQYAQNVGRPTHGNGQ